ncbi:MAG TPA: glutamine synthetase, partial [Gammaproteobacteria bacterium]|nr:glutamine synthetase [Gammaproteobacteria bacterium]
GIIDGCLELKRGEVERLNMTTHPTEFGMYYSV